MAEKTAAAKLLIKPGTTAWVSLADHASLFEPLPDGATWTDALAEATTAIMFADDERSLRALLAEHAGELGRPEHLWIAYPKGGRADINRDSLYPIVAELTAMRPITQVSLDATWSALRFRPLKPGEPPFTPRR